MCLSLSPCVSVSLHVCVCVCGGVCCGRGVGCVDITIVSAVCEAASVTTTLSTNLTPTLIYHTRIDHFTQVYKLSLAGNHIRTSKPTTQTPRNIGIVK